MARSIEDILSMRNILIEEECLLNENLNINDIRFAFVKTPYWDKIDDDSKVNLENFISNLIELKVNVEEIDLNNLILESSEIHKKISGFEFKRSISAERFHHYNELSDILRNGRLSDGENMSLSDYHYLFDHLEKHKHMINNKISSYDCIISPSALGEALSGLEYTGSPVLNTTWTLLGLPSITLPMFKSKNNLPIGCQFISKKADDNKLLSISKKILLEFS